MLSHLQAMEAKIRKLTKRVGDDEQANKERLSTIWNKRREGVGKEWSD